MVRFGERLAEVRNEGLRPNREASGEIVGETVGETVGEILGDLEPDLEPKSRIANLRWA